MDLKFLKKTLIQPKEKLVSLKKVSTAKVAMAGFNSNLMLFSNSSDCDLDCVCDYDDCNCDCYKEPKKTTKKQMHVLRKYGNLSESELKKMSKHEKQAKVDEIMEEYRAEQLYDDCKPDCDCDCDCVGW